MGSNWEAVRETTFPIFSERLVFEPASLRFAKEVYALTREKEVCQYLLWDAHKNINETRRVLKDMVLNRKKRLGLDFLLFTKESNQLIGLIGVSSYNDVNRSVEIGYWLGKEFWNKGYATEALKVVIKYCFEELRMVRVYARHFKENTASGKVMQKAGMSYEGTHRKTDFAKGKFWDCVVYAVVRE